MKKFDHELPLTVSKSGTPCLYECGGGYSNTGHAQVIADANGKPKRAIYIPNHGDLACGNHALIPVKAGDLVVISKRHRHYVELNTYRIEAFTAENALLVLVDDSVECDDMEQAAFAKSFAYHCREPYYIAVPNPAPAPIAPPADNADFDFGDDDLDLTDELDFWEE